jgi:hypothetical protein
MISVFATPIMWPSKLGRTGNRNLVAIRPEKLNY